MRDVVNQDMFKIDENASDDEYLYVDVKDRGTVVIKREGDGIVVDVYPFRVVDQPVASTWAHMSDLFPEDDGGEPDPAPRPVREPTSLAGWGTHGGDNAGCDECGNNDRLPGSKYCAGHQKNE